MPKLVNHLNRLTNARFYDDVELATLQTVYDRARQALDIDVTDPRRERLAMLIFQVADGSSEPDVILERVITLFGHQN